MQVNATEAAFEFLEAYVTVSIAVENIESFLQIFLLQESLLLECGCQELGVVDLAVSIRISGSHHLNDVRSIELEVVGHLLHVCV